MSLFYARSSTIFMLNQGVNVKQRFLESPKKGQKCRYFGPILGSKRLLPSIFHNYANRNKPHPKTWKWSKIAQNRHFVKIDEIPKMTIFSIFFPLQNHEIKSPKTQKSCFTGKYGKMSDFRPFLDLF